MRNWDTILESHGRLDGERSVTFEFFTLLELVFQVFKVRLIKIFKIEPPDLLFLVVFISFYISRYHFSQIFRTSFRIIRKKDFPREFSFLTNYSCSNLSTALIRAQLGIAMAIPSPHSG